MAGTVVSIIPTQELLGLILRPNLLAGFTNSRTKSRFIQTLSEGGVIGLAGVGHYTFDKWYNGHTGDISFGTVAANFAGSGISAE